jgi:hypothetical protein
MRSGVVLGEEIGVFGLVKTSTSRFACVLLACCVLPGAAFADGGNAGAGFLETPAAASVATLAVALCGIAYLVRPRRG